MSRRRYNECSRVSQNLVKVPPITRYIYVCYNHINLILSIDSRSSFKILRFVFFPDAECGGAQKGSKLAIASWIATNLIRNAAKGRSARTRTRREMFFVSEILSVLRQIDLSLSRFAQFLFAFCCYRGKFSPYVQEYKFYRKRIKANEELNSDGNKNI